LDKQDNDHFNEQISEQNEPIVSQSGEKKPFVEPAVSVPVDVLEATTFFQTPTIEVSSV
jgi:hypothetical protein